MANLFEVGGGDGWLRQYVAAYFNVDGNPTVKPDYCGDWLRMPLNGHIGGWGGFLSAAVIEHCERPEPFLDKVVELHPDTALITFFTGLRDEDEIREPQSDKNGDLFYCNSYSKNRITEWADASGKEYELFQVGTDWLLALNTGGRCDWPVPLDEALERACATVQS